MNSQTSGNEKTVMGICYVGITRFASFYSVKMSKLGKNTFGKITDDQAIMLI